MTDLITHKKELEASLGNLLTRETTSDLKMNSDLGRFECTIQRYEHFSTTIKKFQNNTDSLAIPFYRYEPCISMIFQFSGKSVYRDKFNPIILNSFHHSLNYFNGYECSILLDEKATQYDVTFTLEESFYKTIATDGLTTEAGTFFEHILNKRKLNTLAEKSHQPMDAGMHGVIQNILNCPYKGEIRELYISAQLQALLLLQFCHLHTHLNQKPILSDNKITKRDQDILIDIQRFLDNHYLDVSTLTDISKQFGMNVFKLKYGFKKLFNTSPIKYIYEKRLELASFLLTETEKSVAEISDQIGYAHANNFSLAFRRKFGVSPQRYRSGMLN